MLNFLDLGLRAIRKRHDAEKILIFALETEAQLIETQGGNNHYISILAEILDRSLDKISEPESIDAILNGLVWKELNKLYHELSSTRSKFLRRFGEISSTFSFVCSD